MLGLDDRIADLAGGSWLLALLVALLGDGGLRVLVPERLPPNDGAI